MRRGLLLGLLAALLVGPPALPVVPVAQAGTNGSWTPVTEQGSNISLVGLHRTSDGVLHMVWRRDNQGSGDILTRIIPPDGTVGPIVPIVNWPAVGEPDIVANPAGGLLTIWPGIKGPLEAGSATSDDTGGAWSEGGEPVTNNAVYASPISMETGADGTVFEAWYGTGGTFVHRGTDPASPNHDYQAPLGGYAFSAPNLARDGADGSLWLGWPVFDAKANNGAYANQVDPATGAPAGAAIKMPGSSTEFNGETQSQNVLSRWPITGRPGRAGVFMAAPANYPRADRIILWRVGQPTSTTLDNGSGNHRQVAIAADPDGRIAVIWGTDGGAHSRLFARVSDTNVTSFGPAFEVPTPPGMTSLWGIAAEMQSGGLIDLFANVTEADNSTERYYHTQALAPPVLAKSVNARVVSGAVSVQLPGTKMFVPVTHDSQIPVGAIVDATKGRIRIVTALPGGTTQSSDFFQGSFRVTQVKSGLATMVLAGGSFASCGKAKRAQAAKAKVMRQLWGAGKGKFRTKGKYAAAATRGTTWLTVDRCDGTLVRVTAGAVTVRDLVKKVNVVVTKGRSYLAKKR